MFGLVDTSHKPALGVMQVVTQRDAATLLPLVQYTKPNTEVWSDEWRAYNNIGSLANVSRHQMVSHSLHFKDPVTAVHTEHIESYWNRIKTKLKRMKGCHRSQLPSFLDEFMWFVRHGTAVRQAFDDMPR